MGSMSCLPIFLLGLLALPMLYRQFPYVSTSMEFFFYFLSGFSIKAVPFPNAILNVKELGGKKHPPNMTIKKPGFSIVSLF